jgi:hypothetical protein
VVLAVQAGAGIALAVGTIGWFAFQSLVVPDCDESVADCDVVAFLAVASLVPLGCWWSACSYLPRSPSGAAAVPRCKTSAVRRPGLLALLYLVVGLVVASQKDYLVDIDTLRRVVSAVLAIVFWPLVLLGVDMRIH